MYLGPTGLEPVRLAAGDFKSPAYTNSATGPEVVHLGRILTDSRVFFNG